MNLFGTVLALTAALALPLRASASPTIKIISPKKANTTNTVLNASGTAAGGIAAVYYSFNGGSWTVANGTTNWSVANLQLTPGSNVFSAYALGTNSVASHTNKVVSTYVVNVPLTVQTNGFGSVSPDYHGKLLQIQKTYTITAKPGKGFGFAGWSGNAFGISPKLKFAMDSNLTFIANFADIQRPVCIVAVPAVKHSVSNSLITISGRASDNVGVAGVNFQLNGGGWYPASLGPDGTNWSASGLLLTPGTNTLQVYAVDAAGNPSLTSTVKFFDAGPPAVSVAYPLVVPLGPNGDLTWPSIQTHGIAVVQTSSDMSAGSWSPFFYDLASNFEPLPVILYGPGGYYQTNYNHHFPSDDMRVTQLPPSASSNAFYRVAMQTNPPDPSLVLHLPFDNDFSDQAILDTSGYGNHALQYSPTNWPVPGIGPDGSRAGVFSDSRTAPPPLDPNYSQGDYAGIPYSPSLDNLSNGTVLVWTDYDPGNQNSTSIDASAYDFQVGSWYLGRTYDVVTRFGIGVPNGLYDAVIFPDRGVSGAWHYYGVTWDGTSVIGYYDGVPISTNVQAVSELKIGSTGGNPGWIAIGCKVHGGTAQWGDPDILPNWGWLGGKMDDVRIYNRTLSGGEISNLFTSFDHQPPSVPQNVRVNVDASSQIEVRWDPSTDNFRVDGYRVLRDGVTVSTNVGTAFYVDTGLSPSTAYTYTVQAFDPAGNLSALSVPVQATTLAEGSQVEVIVDDLDGAPSVTVVGGPWLPYNGAPFPDSYGPDFLYCTSTGTGSVTFRPSLPESGNYSVYLWHPANGYPNPFSPDAPVDIVSGSTTNTISVNEKVNYGMWDLIGTFNLSVGTNSFVQIRPAVDADLTTADAVRFVK